MANAALESGIRAALFDHRLLRTSVDMTDLAWLAFEQLR